MKKGVLFFSIFSSSLLLGEGKHSETKDLNQFLITKQEVENRLETLKKEELYIQELEKKLGKKIIITEDLNSKYNKLKKNFLTKDLEDLDNKKEFLEFEKQVYDELLERVQHIEDNNI